MSGLRSLRRSVKKAQGEPLRFQPAKASDGSYKGPARMPTLAEFHKQRKSYRKEAK